MNGKWTRALRELSILADNALADRILDAERLKSAELRLQMILQGQHMCLTPGCRRPVIGKLIFGHCESHLADYERRWLDQDVESPNWRREPGDDSEHPIVTGAREAQEARDREIVEEVQLSKQKALGEARDLVAKDRALRLERRAFLPKKLARRIFDNNSAQEEDVSWNSEEESQ